MAATATFLQGFGHPIPVQEKSLAQLRELVVPPHWMHVYHGMYKELAELCNSGRGVLAQTAVACFMQIPAENASFKETVSALGKSTYLLAKALTIWAHLINEVSRMQKLEEAEESANEQLKEIVAGSETEVEESE